MSLKKVLFGTAVSLVALTAVTSDARAQEPCGNKPYVAIRSGLAMLKNHIDKNTWDVGAAVGMQLNSFRTEFEYTFRGGIKGNAMGGEHKLETMSMLVNGYYDMYTGSSFHPYLNLGIGASRLYQKDGGINSHTDFKFSWGGGVGLGFDITRDTTFDLGYRFLDLGREVKSNEFYAGLRFAF